MCVALLLSWLASTSPLARLCGLFDTPVVIEQPVLYLCGCSVSVSLVLSSYECLP